MYLEVILEAKYIPHGSVVKKITGTTEYTLMDNVTIYSDDSKNRQTIKSDGCKFLVSSSGGITCVSDSKKFILETTLETLNYLLGQSEEGSNEDES